MKINIILYINYAVPYTLIKWFIVTLRVILSLYTKKKNGVKLTIIGKGLLVYAAVMFSPSII
jgi:hypothetical protein